MTIENINKLLGDVAGLVPNPVERLDLRPEQEIRAQLNSHIPVENERNVWAYWGTGFDSMPPWRQKNVINWVRRNGKRWTVRVLDRLPGSPNHIHQFVDPANLPIAINENRMKGRHSEQTISDFLRVAALYQHGGVYLDVGIILLRDLEDICWSALEDPSLPYNVAGGMVDNIAFVSFFLAARRNDPFIHRWLQVFLEVFGSRDSVAGTCHHPLIHHLGLITSPAFPATTNWEDLTDYAAVTQCCRRVKSNCEPGENGFDGPSYFTKHFYVLPDKPELSGSELNSTVFRKALAVNYNLPNDASEDDKENYARASRIVYSTLTGKSMYKFYSGFSNFGVQGLSAKYWDQPENAHEDSQPGTWGEIFRYGTVHYRQTRTVEPLDLSSSSGTSGVGPSTHYRQTTSTEPHSLHMGEITNVGTMDPVVVKS